MFIKLIICQILLVVIQCESSTGRGSFVDQNNHIELRRGFKQISVTLNQTDELEGIYELRGDKFACNETSLLEFVLCIYRLLGKYFGQLFWFFNYLLCVFF